MDGKNEVPYYKAPALGTALEESPEAASAIGAFKRPQPVNIAAYQAYVSALYAKEEPSAECLMGHRKAAVAIAAYDGRATSGKIKKIIVKTEAVYRRKCKAEQAKVEQMQPAFEFRLLHTNHEFTCKNTVLACIQRRNGVSLSKNEKKLVTLKRKYSRPVQYSHGLPDPLETIVVKMSKSYKVGDEVSRGMSNVVLRAGYVDDGLRFERWCWVRLADAGAIYNSLAAAVQDDVVSDCDEGDGPVSDCDEVSAAEDEAPIQNRLAGDLEVPLVPYGKSETTARGLIKNMNPTGVLIPFVGEGVDVLAAVRMKRTCVAFVSSKLHEDVVVQHLRAVILSEQLDSVNDGFMVIRKLQKTRSIGGESAFTDHSAQPAEEGKGVSDGATEKKKKGKRSRSPPSSSDSSDSSSSSSESKNAVGKTAKKAKVQDS